MKRTLLLGFSILLVGLMLSGCTKTIKISDGSTYKGEADLFSSIPNGTGTLTYPDGSQYVGSFAEGLFSGKGTMTYTSHNRTKGHLIKECLRIDGQWNAGKMEGVGTVTWDDGAVYHGDIAENGANGKGVYYHANHTVMYEGDMKNDEFDGQGKLYSEEGDILYTGIFKSGLKEGNGVTTVYKSKGTEGKETLEMFQIFEGAYVGDTLNGVGKIYNKDKQLIYEGELKKDRREGAGKAYQNGCLVYDGLFKGGRITGFGNFYDESSNELEMHEQQEGNLWVIMLEDQYGEEKGSLSGAFDYESYQQAHREPSQIN